MTHALSNPEIPFLREPRDKALLFSILESAARHAADFGFEITRPPVARKKAAAQVFEQYAFRS